MASINMRAKSPTRAEAISKALKPGPNYCTGVLIGNWVEDRIECPKGGSLYFPPKDNTNIERLQPESRQPDFRINKINNLQGNITEWGLKKYLEYEWSCTDATDYLSTLYEDCFLPPKSHQYLQQCERKARNSSFTKTFRFKMTKSKR